MGNLVIAGVFGLAVVAGFAVPLQAEPLKVGAPPSLRAAFLEIVPLFEQEYGTAVTIMYTPSTTLLNQIENRAPIDVFASAGVDEVEYLHDKGLTLNGRPRILARTSLVLVMAADSPATLVSLDDALADPSTRIALGNPEASYLGQVTARALSKGHPAYKHRTRTLYATHTEDILRLIRSGKADVGVVYRANVINNGEVRISDETPFGTEVEVQFAQAVVATCRDSLRSVAEQFSDFLMTPRVLKLLEKYGFDAPSLPIQRNSQSHSSMRTSSPSKGAHK